LGWKASLDGASRLTTSFGFALARFGTGRFDSAGSVSFGFVSFGCVSFGCVTERTDEVFFDIAGFASGGETTGVSGFDAPDDDGVASVACNGFSVAGNFADRVGFVASTLRLANIVIGATAGFFAGCDGGASTAGATGGLVTSRR